MSRFTCKDCDKRYIGCHDECEAFLENKTRLQEERKKIRDVKNEAYESNNLQRRKRQW